jgi:ribose 5-phosphate isomerase A
MTLSPADMKRLAAEAALEYVPPIGVIGVGSGSTVDVFIDVLAEAGFALDGVVPASDASAAHLEARGLKPLSLAEVGGTLPLVVDGCDEADPKLRLIKGAGGAMTREKVVASTAELFVVIADETKLVPKLGTRMPVPVEVIPMAEPYVRAQLLRLGGTPELRPGYLTDNGGIVLDTSGLPLEYPETLERTLAAVPGVIGTGVFAIRSADVGLFATRDGDVRRFVRQR